MSSTGHLKRFHPVDYVLFAIVITISLSIGITAALTGGRQRTTQEYLLGDRRLSVIPVAISIVMSFFSAVFVIGTSAEVYTYGLQFWWVALASCIAYEISAAVFVPLLFPLKLTSSFEYLERRFQSRAVKIIGAIYLMISQSMYMGMAMFAPATALEAVTGFPVWGSILASGLVATIYTTIGGMKAVVWTDVFQGIVYIIGIIIVLALGSNAVGGFTKVWDIASHNGRTQPFNFNPDPTERMTFWSIMVGWIFFITQNMGTGQISFQRYCSLPTLKEAKRSVLLNTPCVFFVTTIICAVGLVIFAYYENIGCDPLRAGYISSPNQLLPYFVMDVVNYPGIPGVFLAVMFSGALSSLSSSLSGLSAVAWKDILEYKFHHVSESRKALITKCLVAFFGVVGVILAFLAGIFHGHILQVALTFVTAVIGPLLGLFVLGAFFPRSNYIGASVGSIVGLIFGMTIAIGSTLSRPHVEVLPTSIDGCMNVTNPRPIAVNPENVPVMFRISYLLNCPMGMLVSVILGYILSLCTGPMDPSKIDPALFVDVLDKISSCLPRPIRRMFRLEGNEDIEVTLQRDNVNGLQYKSCNDVDKIGSEDAAGTSDINDSDSNNIKLEQFQK